jgi:hypothetical protein
MNPIIVILVAVCFFFLLIREVVIWYLKINIMISHLKEIEENLSLMLPVLKKQAKYQNDVVNLLCGIALKQNVEQAFFPSDRNS